MCLSKEKRAELKRIHGYDIIQCAGNCCPYYAVECGRENIQRFEEAQRRRRKFRLDDEKKEGSKVKYTYYVAILHNDNSIEYVTRIDNSTKTFYCEKGKPALKLTKTRAEDLMFGMVANCCTAAVIKTPDFYELSNKESEDNGREEA